MEAIARPMDPSPYYVLLVPLFITVGALEADYPADLRHPCSLFFLGMDSNDYGVYRQQVKIGSRDLRGIWKCRVYLCRAMRFLYESTE